MYYLWKASHSQGYCPGGGKVKVEMGGDFAGCTSIRNRKKSSSGGSGNSSSNGSVGGSNNNSNSSSSNKNDSAKGRRILDNNGMAGNGDGGVLIPVHHYKDPLKTYKIVILGDGGVGKSGES